MGKHTPAPKRKPALATALLRVMQIFPFVVVIALVLLFWLYRDELSVEAILTYTPADPVAAACILFLLYALKSISVVFPIAALYLASGKLFAPLLAVGINLLGTAIALTIPYCIGRFAGREFAEKLIQKYPKVKQIDQFQQENVTFVSYIVKVVGFIPADVSSMVLGSMHVAYGRYLLGGVLGMAPVMLAITCLGHTVTEPGSPAFIASAVATVAISVGSILLYRWVLRRRSRKQ